MCAKFEHTQLPIHNFTMHVCNTTSQLEVCLYRELVLVHGTHACPVMMCSDRSFQMHTA